MTRFPTRLLLSLVAPLALAPAALAKEFPKDCPVCQTLDKGAKALDGTFISFGEGDDRQSPPLTPSMINGGIDEIHATDLHLLSQGNTPLMAQNRPYRALDGYRQYAVHMGTGEAAPTRWSEEDWAAYGNQFKQSVEGPDGFDPAQRIRIRQFYAGGPVRFTNEQGRTLFEGYNAFISDRATLRTGAFLFTFEPELRLHNNARTGYDSRMDVRYATNNTFYGIEDRNGLEIMEATAQADIYGAHLTVGRQSLVWGPGYHQQLLLSANAAPMWMIHLTSSEPLALPGGASKLGYFSPEVFVAQLDHDRPVPRILMSGVRMGWQITPYLKAGINLVSTFGGKGQDVTADDFLFNLTSINSDNLPNATSDQKCSWDVRFLSPWASAPFEVYMENGYETRSSWNKITQLKSGWHQPAWIAGVHLPSLDQNGKFSATLEYAQTGPTWYVANSFGNNKVINPTTDYAYLNQGQAIGAPMGGDANSLFAEVRAKVSTGVEAYVNTTFEQHGLDNSAAATETLWETKLGADADLGRSVGMFKGWHGEATLIWDRWRDFQGVSGQNENGIAFGIGLRRGF